MNEQVWSFKKQFSNHFIQSADYPGLQSLIVKRVKLKYRETMEKCKTTVEAYLGGEILFRTSDSQLRQAYIHITKNPKGCSKRRILNLLS